MQANTEHLKFKVGVSGTYWDRQPEFTICVNGNEYVSGLAHTETQYYEFEAVLAEDQPHALQIRLTNKTDADVVESDDKSQILKDMLLNIDYVSIDDLELGKLLWSQSKFVADNAEKPTLTECVNLGWNGTYTLEFRSPFYMWLLDYL